MKAFKKYEKVSQEDYETWRAESKAYRERVSMDKNRLRYHLMPETGWLNDPNGLCQLHGVYHIYYQYDPFEPTGEIKLWGHYTTRDFVRYRAEKPVLFPDQEFDAHGVYSGSAFVEKGRVHYFYTGNVKYFDREDYDYILSGRGSNTIHCESRDGYHFSEKKLVMENNDYPPDISAHVRDPKILKHEGTYYMVLGARDQESRGLVLAYRSPDLKNWEYYTRITSKEAFGYMWECPDLFWLGGQLCLICCPQGVEKQGVDFENVHQCTAVMLNGWIGENTCEIEDNSRFQQLDRGFDFYAPQTFEDERGRRILIGWMGIPDADYVNPTAEAGWQHALTIPRVLRVKERRLIQEPAEELKSLRRTRTDYEKEELSLGLEVGTVFEARIDFEACSSMTLGLRTNVTLIYENGLLTLDLGEGGWGRTRRSVKISYLKELWIYSDTSSLELFVNGGEEVFTTRVYDQGKRIQITGDYSGRAALYELEGFLFDV